MIALLKPSGPLPPSFAQGFVQRSSCPSVPKSCLGTTSSVQHNLSGQLCSCLLSQFKYPKTVSTPCTPFFYGPGRLSATQKLDISHLHGAASEDLPGDTRRSTIRPRRNLRGWPEGIRRGTWPGGHRGGTTQRGPTSRRWPRSWASRPRSGGRNSGSSPLRRGAGCGRPGKQTEKFNCNDRPGIPVSPSCPLQCSTTLYTPLFGFEWPHQASGCLQSYFRLQLT